MLSFQERIWWTKLNDQVNKMEIGQWGYKIEKKIIEYNKVFRKK